jgi:hypothetical protein
VRYTTFTTMRLAPLPWFALSLSLTFLWAPVANAYDPKDDVGSGDDAKLARSWFAEGVLAEKAGLTDKACEAFRAALLLRRAPQLAGKLVTCLVREGRPWEAADLALYALSDKDAPAAEQARLGGLLAKLRESLGWIHVEVDRIGADVFVAGRHVGRSPFPRVHHVVPGRVVVRAEILDQGEHKTEATVEVRAGSQATVSLHLRAPEAALPTPAAAAPAPAPASAPTSRRGRSTRDLGVAAGATVAATAAVTGGVLFVLHAQALDDADQFSAEVDQTTGHCPVVGKTGACLNLYNALVRSDDFGNAGIGAFVAAGVVGAATLGFWFATAADEPTAASAIEVSPLAGRDVAGLVVRGRLP